MSALIDVSLEQRRDLWLARMAGEIDSSNAFEIQGSLLGAIPNTAAGLVVDLSGVKYLDSSGIHLLFLLRERLNERGQRLAAVVPESAQIRRVLLLTDIDALVPVTPTIEEALVKMEA